jgi:hypothetical protein
MDKRGRVSNMFWKQRRNKKIFSIHFDAKYEEFNQLVQIGYLNLVGHLALPQPQAPPNPPLQLHPRIFISLNLLCNHPMMFEITIP